MCDDFTLPSTLKVIGDYAFYGTFELHEFDLPASLEEIGSYAFAENDGLYEINIPESVTRIGSYAFYRCYSISVSFAKSGALKEIEHHAFSDCYMLEKIILPEGLEILGDFAFANCDTLLSLHLPSTLREIGEGAISTYYYSSEITIADGNEYFKVTDASLYSADGKILYLAAMNSKYEFKVIDGCEVINAYAFYKVSPHTLYLPKSVKLIGEHAFESCNEFYTLYYEGNEEDWDGIVIGDYNSSLDSLEVTFNTY